MRIKLAIAAAGFAIAATGLSAPASAAGHDGWRDHRGDWNHRDGRRGDWRGNRNWDRGRGWHRGYRGGRHANYWRGDRGDRYGYGYGRGYDGYNRGYGTYGNYYGRRW